MAHSTVILVFLAVTMLVQFIAYPIMGKQSPACAAVLDAASKAEIEAIKKRRSAVGGAALGLGALVAIGLYASKRTDNKQILAVSASLVLGFVIASFVYSIVVGAMYARGETMYSLDVDATYNKCISRNAREHKWLVGVVALVVGGAAAGGAKAYIDAHPAGA